MSSKLIERQRGILVSVIVPVYNCEGSLHLTLESLLRQTYSNIEIILVDDGSKDGSGYLCDQYSEVDSRVTAFHQINKGLAGARNSGIKLSHGEYISFIDAGDYVELNLYESLLPYVNQSIDLIDFPYYSQNSQNERFPAINKIKKNKVFSRDFIEEKMLPCMLNIEDNPTVNDPPICFSVKYLFKKSIIEENGILFDERRRKWEDKGFVLKYVDNSENVVFYDKPLYTYLCLGTGETLSSSYFRNLVFLIIEQREDYQKKFGERYSFETDYYYANSISIIMCRIEEIVFNEKEDIAKDIIDEVYSKPFVQKIASWSFSGNNPYAHYQELIKSQDINSTYLLMQQHIKHKAKKTKQEGIINLIKRVKGKVKRIMRPLYHKLKA